MQRGKLLWTLIALAGCAGGGGGNMLPGFDPGPAPTNGFQIVLPVVKGIKAGSDNEICTWTETITDRVLDIRTLQALQSHTGHHIIVYTTKKFQAAGTTRPCSEDDMTTLNYVVGLGGEGYGGFTVHAPADLIYRIPAGHQIVLNHHYLNATSHDMDVQSALNVTYSDVAKSYTPIGTLIFVDTSINLAKGKPTHDFTCELIEDFNAFYFVPHMHRWGTRIWIDHQKGDKSERVFDVTPWSESFVFQPPAIERDPSDPYQFRKGDKVTIHCEWELDEPMTFGMEMCTSLVQTIDRDNLGTRVCNTGNTWSNL